MHHHPRNQEELQNLSILPVSGPGKFPVLSQIKPQAPHLFQTCDHTPQNPETLISLKKSTFPPKSNYELLTAAILVYTIRAGITAAAGTRLAL
ncbi:hypothetical protein BLNAU_22772 [Blattamonas nauphoetae]|uniref:Uncharacterized protein n=1 Tax=Blattamonas nauphoetae TaxID=2049346 RepID=A0ABQ9WS40_9EUKA|nr:hypothetical protein BLNAU_22772 [Blattamonas nauphoetae]